MRDTREFAKEIFMELKGDTLKIFAKSHGIKIGKNKRLTIENIIERCDRWKTSISAIPGKDIGIIMVFTPARNDSENNSGETETETTCDCGANPACKC